MSSNMKDSTAQYMSRKYTATYYAALRGKNINNICFSYLGSKAFRDKTIYFLVARWSGMTEDDIITDLLSVNNGDIYQHPFPYSRKYPSLYWIVTNNCMDIVPMNVIKKLPMNIWSEDMLDTHGSRDMDKFEIKTMRKYLLDSRKTPQEVKDYLK